MSNLIVYAEIDDGLINDISLQCLATARRIADQQGSSVSCVTAGANVAETAATLFGYGADNVFAAESVALEGYIAKPYTSVVGAWIATQDSPLVLFPASTLGNDLAASIAASLNAPCMLDCDSLEPAGDTYTLKRSEFDRKVMTSFAAVSGRPVIASLRDGITEIPATNPAKTGSVTPVEVALDDTEQLAKVLRRNVAKKTVNLKDAKIIVAGGAGVGTKENFELIQRLADTLNAEIGATRAVVDAGWMPADHQVGQTGATVRPELYIACGISGAVQHRVGMCDSGKIIAINVDANAPIFHIAHYKIVGDLKEVIPKLLKLLG
jgi:electron transfer flavoprotein alpha subunit